MFYRESQSELTFRQAKSFTHCTILAFAVMSNHLHFIIEGTEKECLYFFNLLIEKINDFFKYHGRAGMLDNIEPGCTAITSVDQLRNEIAYVIRNPFVARSDVNLFACPMTSGHLYFNPLLRKDGVPANTLKGRALRDFTRTRKDIALSGDVYVLDGVAQAWSFVNYKRAMSFFDNAQQFIMCALKNVEAQVEVALRCNESVVLNDQELFSVTIKLARELFGCEKLSDLPRRDKSLLALELKKRYRISNAQIARITNLPRIDVDAMFPLAAKPR